MTYDKSDIMKTAWAWFNNEDVELENIEYADDSMVKTFANCLKASWNRAKVMAEDLAETINYAKNAEEVKAFDWACKKLDLDLNMTNVEKVRAVSNISKSWNFTLSIYQAAMKAVRFYL